MIDLSKIEDRRLAENVLIGRDGYIFLRNDRNNTIAQITGKKVLTGRLLRAWQTLFELRNAWFAQRGISYYYLAAPCKECVYSDYLPDEIRVSENRPLMQLIRHLEKNNGSKIVYPLNLLRPENNTQATYPKGDSHWNWYGAYVAYLELMRHINESQPNPLRVLTANEIEFTDEPMASDLSAKIGLTDIVTRGKVKKPKAHLILRNNVSNIGNYRVFENENKKYPRAIMFRDSFSNYTMHYMAESFSRFVVVWQPNIDYSIVRHEMPDFVISQQAERFMVVVPDDLGGSTNRGHVAGKVKDGIVSEDQARIVRA